MARHRRVEAVGISWTGRGLGVGENRVVLLCRQQRIWSTPSRGSRFTALEIRDGVAGLAEARAGIGVATNLGGRSGAVMSHVQRVRRRPIFRSANLDPTERGRTICRCRGGAPVFHNGMVKLDHSKPNNMKNTSVACG